MIMAVCNAGIFSCVIMMQSEHGTYYAGLPYCTMSEVIYMFPCDHVRYLRGFLRVDVYINVSFSFNSPIHVQIFESEISHHRTAFLNSLVL